MLIRGMLRAPEGDAPGGAAPAATTPQTTTTTTAPAPKAPVQTPVEEPTFIGARIDRARREIAKELGVKVKKGEDIGAKIAEKRQKDEDRKARLKAAEEKAAAEEAKAASANAALKVYADAAIAGMTDAEKAILKTIGGDAPTPEKVLEVAAMLKVAAPAKAEKTETAPAGEKPLVAPATTGTPQGAPPPTAPSAPAPVKEQIKQLRAIQDPTKRALSVALFAINNEDALLRDS